MNFYKRHLGDYAKKAGHLSPLEHGVFNLILDAYYDREQAPTLVEAIRFARARTEEEKGAVVAVLDEFFTEVDGRYVQNRVEEEIAAYKQQAETNRAVAVERERRRKARTENDDSTNRARSVNEPCTEKAESCELREPSHKPLAISHKPEVKAEKTQRATRLPADWSPSAEEIAYCQAERPELNPQTVAANFRDYWIAKPGKEGTKLDWSATWRTWVRNERALPTTRASPQKPDKFNLQNVDRSGDQALAEASRRKHGIVIDPNEEYQF